MSDMEDDFMCDDEEDYDLVFTIEFDFVRLNVGTLYRLSPERRLPLNCSSSSSS